MKKAFVFLLLLVAYGCVTPQNQYTWDIEAKPQTVENEYIRVTLRPTEWSSGYNSGYQRGYKAFYLEVKNKTSSNIELDWNKTLYIEQGQTKGGFMFEGVVYEDRNSPKQPDIIFANTDFARTIWPNNLVDFPAGHYGDWVYQSMPAGQNGIYLTIKTNDKEISEKIIINMVRVDKGSVAK